MNIENKGYYTVDEWLAIFKESLNTPAEDGEKRNFFEFISNEIIGMSNYSNWPDMQYGFIFLETLRYLTNGINNRLIEQYPFKNINLDEFLNDKFSFYYLGMVDSSVFKGKINWGTSIRGAWLDYYDIEKQNGTELPCDGIYCHEEQIFPILIGRKDHETFFAALIIAFDNYIDEIGVDSYKAIQNAFHSNQLHFNSDLYKKFFPLNWKFDEE